MDGLGDRGVLSSGQPVSSGRHLRGQENKRFESLDGSECEQKSHIRRRAHPRQGMDNCCFHIVRFRSGKPILKHLRIHSFV